MSKSSIAGIIAITAFIYSVYFSATQPFVASTELKLASQFAIGPGIFFLFIYFGFIKVYSNNKTGYQHRKSQVPEQSAARIILVTTFSMLACSILFTYTILSFLSYYPTSVLPSKPTIFSAKLIEISDYGKRGQHLKRLTLKQEDDNTFSFPWSRAKTRTLQANSTVQIHADQNGLGLIITDVIPIKP